MDFFVKHCWPPRHHLHFRAVQSAAWKVNLQGAITVHTTRKQSLYCEYHSPDICKPHSLEALSTSFSWITPQSLRSFYLYYHSHYTVPILPASSGSSLLLIVVRLRAKWEGPHRNPGLMLSICWNLLQKVGSHFSRSSAKWVIWMREQTPLTQSLVEHQTAFERQQLDRRKSEAYETGEKKSCCEGTHSYHWSDGNCDPWLPGTVRNTVE